MTKHTSISPTRPKRQKIQDTPEFRAMWRSGEPVSAIARTYQVNPNTVFAAVKRIGLTPRSEPRSVKALKTGAWTEDEDTTLRDMIKGGYLYREIATHLGRSSYSITERSTRLGVNRAANLAKSGPKIAPPRKEPEPEDMSLTGRLKRAHTYAARRAIAVEQGWSDTQVQQRYHRVMAGGEV